MNAKELVAAIAPANKPSYSPNLHAFARRWVGRRIHAPEVWRDADGVLWLGEIDREHPAPATCGFTGVRLNGVLCFGSKEYDRRGWFTNLGPGNMTHIPDFWARYLPIGRCAIDVDHRQHFTGDKERYTMNGSIRTCNWCGAKHLRTVEVEVIEREVERFTPLAANGGDKQ